MAQGGGPDSAASESGTSVKFSASCMVGFGHKFFLLPAF